MIEPRNTVVLSRTMGERGGPKGLNCSLTDNFMASNGRAVGNMVCFFDIPPPSGNTERNQGKSIEEFDHGSD